MAHSFPVLRNLVGLGVCLLLPAFVAVKANANEKKYWVSEHFSEVPNVFDTSTERLAPNYPMVVSLDDIDWAYDTPGDVRLCFDNRSLFSTRTGRKISEDKWIKYCHSYEIKLNYRNAKFDNEYKKKITEGLLVYSSDDGTPTCEATFTIASLYSVLSSMDEGKKLGNGDDFLVFPYFQADGDPFHGYAAIKKYLDNRDTFEASKLNGHKIQASLTNSISCLLPAYQRYWQTVRDQCLKVVSKENQQISTGELFIPILKLLEEDFQKIANNCPFHN